MASKRPTKKGRQRSTKTRTSPSVELKKREGVSTPVKVILIGAAILMALSTVLGALGGIIGNNSGNSISSMEDVNNMYQSQVEAMEKELEGDPENVEKLNSVANNYMSWAQMASIFASGDQDTLKVNDLYEKAIGYLDRSLAIEDSADARSTRAMALLYEGEGSTAESAMAETVEKFPEDANAWANYGLVLEQRGSEQEARDAYAKAIELDPEDEKGAKTYAEGRLKSLDDAAAASAVETPNGTGVEGLTETLEQQTGTGF